MASIETRFHNPFTHSINKESVREFAADQLARAHSVVLEKFSRFVGSDSLKVALGYRSLEEQALVNQSLEKIQQLGQEKSQVWRTDNYLNSDTFEAKIQEKALEYAQGHEEDPTGNYWQALDNKHDQALAVAEFFQEFSDGVNNLREITDEDKATSAYFLSEKIRKYGADLVRAETREQVIANGLMTKEEVEASLRSGLVQYADVQPGFNQAGFNSEQEWNDAVYKTAAGLLEDRLLNQIYRLANINEEQEIYIRAKNIYEKRIKTQIYPDHAFSSAVGQTIAIPKVSPQMAPAGINGHSSDIHHMEPTKALGTQN